MGKRGEKGIGCCYHYFVTKDCFIYSETKYKKYNYS
jgi:hypothetical protein